MNPGSKIVSTSEGTVMQNGKDASENTGKIDELQASQYLKSISKYDAESGILIRTKRYNNRKIGGRIGCLNLQGYWQTTARPDGYHYKMLNHRHIFILHNGMIPPGMSIDHKDRCTVNNHINNLRLATGRLQHLNRTKQKGQFDSDFQGVEKFHDKWLSKFINIELGIFESEIEAARIYDYAVFACQLEAWALLNVPESELLIVTDPKILHQVNKCQIKAHIEIWADYYRKLNGELYQPDLFDFKDGAP